MRVVLSRWLAVAAALYLLFFFGLTRTGLIGPDEPRYASIGREMARSGDWVTPHLWGQPWFEKPPLLYWMVASASRLGLGDDLAPRLPVALLSVAFLLAYFGLLRAEFGTRPALLATAILGTSGAWVGFSQVGVTDLPLAATFSAAMLLGLRWLTTGDRRWLVGAGFLMGLAVLAKGLVPLVLALPLVWAGRRRAKDLLWPLPAAVFLLTAAPWYVLCTLRNGRPFLADFFLKQHFARFTSGVQLHPQPFWFYVPILAAGLFPWTPLLVLLFRRSLYSDARRRFLLLWAVFGFLFFSASAGKLPGYLLPLVPAVAALAGLALDQVNDRRWLLAACCLMLVLIPVISASLPLVLLQSFSRSSLQGWHWGFASACCLAAALVWWLETARRRTAALGVMVVVVVSSLAVLKARTLPDLDRLDSARWLWIKVASNSGNVCVDKVDRNWRYGLNYYSVAPLAECGPIPKPVRIRQRPNSPPFVD